MNGAVSVVILTHNRIDYTRWCLAALSETSYRPLEVVFVDNGSTDGTPDILRRFASASGSIKCAVIENAGNLGCSTARNMGAEAASSDIVIFMDNDTAVRTRRWVEGLTAPLDDAAVGATGPKLVYPFSPYLIQFAGGAVSPAGKVDFMGRGRPRETPEYNIQREVQCTISACMAMRRDTFLAKGGFDEAFNPVQYEDIDLSYRLRRDGYRLLYVPRVEMYHFENVTTRGSADVRGTYQIIKNGILFKKRWREMFSTEGGPDESGMRWANIERRDIGEIRSLEFV